MWFGVAFEDAELVAREVVEVEVASNNGDFVLEARVVEIVVVEVFQRGGLSFLRDGGGGRRCFLRLLY